MEERSEDDICPKFSQRFPVWRLVVGSTPSSKALLDVGKVSQLFHMLAL